MIKKIYHIKFNKYRKRKNPRISYIFDKILLVSIICDKRGSKNGKIIEEEKSVEILKIF